MDTLTALEEYLEEYNGVLVIVSHDRFFTDKVTDHLFVFEGNGAVKDFVGTLSDYSECLVELENLNGSSSSSSSQSSSNNDSNNNVDGKNREDKQVRVQKMNDFKKNKREMQKLEKDIEKLKEEASVLEKQIETSSNEGWSKLAELTNKMNGAIASVEEKEMRWLELAEMVEEVESQ